VIFLTDGRRKSIREFLSKKQETIVNLLVFAVIFAFLVSYFKPNLILLDTTTSGGDTGSHNYPLWYLKYGLLPKLRLSGWSLGWYAGFPMFQFYFVIPFLLMVALSYIIPLWVSFKIVTILGIFMLPVAAFAFMRLMKFKYPTPIVAALLTLPFLFMEANSMWGGNIPSTLAGEFSYSISLALSTVFLGLVYNVIKFNRKSRALWVLASVVFALTLLTHIYTAFFVAFVPVFFVLARDVHTIAENIKRNFIPLFKIYFLAFLLSAFWTVPLLMKVQYATPYHYVWSSVKFENVLPEILMPTMVLAALGMLVGLKKSDDRIKYLLLALIISFTIYKVSPSLGMTDIRFVPFLQFIPALIAAYVVCDMKPMQRMAFKFIPVIIIAALTLLWVQEHVTFIDFWIKWNYEGFQNKIHYDQLSGMMDYIRDLPPGRVVHEYSNSHDKFGTPRTFENMPLFSGKPTLEGLNIESALSSPYTFVIQAEMSATATCPIPGLRCGTFNIKATEKHLELFNIRYIVATSDKLKDAIKGDTDWVLLKSFKEIDVYEVGNTDYVSVPENRPLLFSRRGDNWKNFSLEWFKAVKDTDVPIAFVENPTQEDYSRFGPEISALSDIVRMPLETDCTVFSEEVTDDEIRINTDCIGRPLLVKMSYFPNWKIEGADKIYLVSPSFMMVFPEQEDVRLYYGHTFSDLLGNALTILGLSAAVLLLMFRKVESHEIYKHLG
jgi:uncharacterized membrane protein